MDGWERITLAIVDVDDLIIALQLGDQASDQTLRTFRGSINRDEPERSLSCHFRSMVFKSQSFFGNNNAE